MFPSSPTRSPPFLPPGSESSFVRCHVSKLTNPLLPLPPLQPASSRFQVSMFPRSPAHSSVLLPSCLQVVHTSSPLYHFALLSFPVFSFLHPFQLMTAT